MQIRKIYCLFIVSHVRRTLCLRYPRLPPPGVHSLCVAGCTMLPDLRSAASLVAFACVYVCASCIIEPARAAVGQYPLVSLYVYRCAGPLGQKARGVSFAILRVIFPNLGIMPLRFTGPQAGSRGQVPPGTRLASSSPLPTAAVGCENSSVEDACRAGRRPAYSSG